MARRKDYYGSNNKKTKDGMKILENFLKIAIALTFAIATSGIDLTKWLYNSYKDRQTK